MLRTVDNRYSVFENSLTIYGYSEDDDCVYLRPNKGNALYCVELAQKGNLPETLDIFEKLVESYGYEDNARCVLFYTKNPVILDDSHDNFCTKQSIYLFSYSKPMVEEIAEILNSRIKNYQEIISALFDVGLVNTYYNDRDSFKLKSYIDTHNYHQDQMAYLFRSIFAEGIYKAVSDTENYVGGNKERSFKVYQGIGYTAAFGQSKPDIIKCFSEDWRGYIAFNIDFSRDRVKRSIRTWRDAARTFETDRDIKEGYQEFDSNIFPTENSKYIVSNILAVIDNKYALKRISNHINVSFFEKTVFTKNLIYKTPIESRDTSLDFLSHVSDANRYIKAIHKDKDIVTPKSRDIYGSDISGNYITYSFSESNSPHWTVIAPTRSGKTFFVMKMISQTIGANIVPNPEYNMKGYEQIGKDGFEIPKAMIESCTKLGKNRVVQFDIGQSAYKWVRELKKRYPKEVLVFEDNINELRFGLTDIRWNKESNSPDQEDMTFSLAVISLILEMGGGEPLVASEKTQIIEAFSTLYQEKSYEGLSLRKLKQIGGYQEVLAGIKEHFGDLDELTMLSDIKGLERVYPFLCVPLLEDIKVYLTMKSNNYLTKDMEREAALSASSKISTIQSSPIFGYYSKADIKDSYYFYMELETIKSLGENVFIPVFILIFQKLYRRDVKKAQYFKNRGKTPPKIFYIIEEAHNFRKKSLESLFDVALREAARYNIHCGFITQSAYDYNPSLLYNVGTKIVLPSDKPDEQANELISYWSSGVKGAEMLPEEKKYIAFFKDYNKKYTAFLKYGGGVITLKPPVSEEDAWIFNSNPVQLDSET
ncbi:MAG TPA: ATP-binding protein [Epsilonproteobacteria bacterium]|nr:ATP-binding protein [Campylobacterota bacterium]